MAERTLVRDLMTVGVTTCGTQTPVDEIARALLNKELEGVVVLDEEGHAVGIVGQEELVRAYSQGNWRELTAEAVMRDGVPQVPPDILLSAAVLLMRDQGVRAVFLMHHAGGITYPAAVLSYKHLLRHIAARDASELIDMGIQAARQNPLDAFKAKRDAARRQAKLSDEE
jgi:predicted transcriptional regulator